jgi:hypothetical protein
LFFTKEELLGIACGFYVTGGHPAYVASRKPKCEIILQEKTKQCRAQRAGGRSAPAGAQLLAGSLAGLAAGCLCPKKLRQNLSPNANIPAATNVHA